MIEDDRALVATMAFFRALRREFINRGCGGECPVPELDAMAPLDRASFVRSMKIALSAAKPDNVARVMGNRAPFSGLDL